MTLDKSLNPAPLTTSKPDTQVEKIPVFSISDHFSADLDVEEQVRICGYMARDLLTRKLESKFGLSHLLCMSDDDLYNALTTDYLPQLVALAYQANSAISEVENPRLLNTDSLARIITDNTFFPWPEQMIGLERALDLHPGTLFSQFEYSPVPNTPVVSAADLKEYRVWRGNTREDKFTKSRLAKLFGLLHGTVNNYEEGRRTPIPFMNQYLHHKLPELMLYTHKPNLLDYLTSPEACEAAFAYFENPGDSAPSPYHLITLEIVSGKLPGSYHSFFGYKPGDNNTPVSGKQVAAYRQLRELDTVDLAAILHITVGELEKCEKSRKLNPGIGQYVRHALPDFDLFTNNSTINTQPKLIPIHIPYKRPTLDW